MGHQINGNSRILKWRYCTISYKAIFWGDIPLHSPYIGLIYGRYLTSNLGSWNAHWSKNNWLITSQFKQPHLTTITKLPHRMVTWPPCLCRWRADDAANASFGLCSRCVAPWTREADWTIGHPSLLPLSLKGYSTETCWQWKERAGISDDIGYHGHHSNKSNNELLAWWTSSSLAFLWF